MLNKIPHSLRGLMLLGLLAWGVYISPMSPITALVMCGGATGGLCWLVYDGTCSLAASAYNAGKVSIGDRFKKVATTMLRLSLGAWWLTGIVAVALSLKAVL